MAAMTTPVTRAAFDTAVIDGNLDTIHAYFAQPHVQTEVIETNMSIIETTPTDPTTWTQRDGALPWFCRRHDAYVDGIHVPLVSAAHNGHVHVIAWFFSTDHTACMGETLALLLPLVVHYNRPPGKNHAHATAAVATILDTSVLRSRTPELLALALAHGGCVDTALPMLARHGHFDCIGILEHTGAWFVGAELLDTPSEFMFEYVHAEWFLVRGVDARGPERLLREAAGRDDRVMVETLLRNTPSLDVDARDCDGTTALMRVAAMRPQNHPLADPQAMACLLLAYCDVNLTDATGRTALHVAIAANNRSVALLLLERGADPRVRDHDGFLAHDKLDENAFGEWWRANGALVERLLACGADPFAVTTLMPTTTLVTVTVEAEAPAVELTLRSLYERLVGTPQGRDFVHAHPHYFDRSDLQY